jgi:predicted transcriptional regulator
MKTAVSIPDDLFHQADKLAADLALSRSALYARALKELVQRLKGEAVTAALNAALAEDPDQVDPFVMRGARLTLAGEDRK